MIDTARYEKCAQCGITILNPNYGKPITKLKAALRAHTVPWCSACVTKEFSDESTNP